MAKVNEDQMTTLSSMVGDIYSNLSQELFIRMIRRIKQRGTADLQDNPYLWQLEKLNDMHMLNNANIDFVIKQTGIAKELIYKIIENEGLKVYKDTAEQLKEDLNRPSFKYNGVQDSLSSLAKQTFLDIDNLINQTLLTTSLGDNSAMRTYKGMLEHAVAEVVTGTKTADKAISDTVMKWLDKGIDSNFIDKGGHVWSIDRYARTVMQSTTYRVYNDMRTKAADEFGIDTFHMSAHAAARPACAPIQGHIVTKADKGFMSDDPKVGRVYSLFDYGYGSAGGTMGINCHHVLTPFVIGINELPDEDIPNPKDAIANGEKQAKQRSYEQGIRDAKCKLEAAEALGDEKLINRYSNLLNTRRSGLRNLLNNNSFLHRDYSREKIYKHNFVKSNVNKQRSVNWTDKISKKFDIDNVDLSGVSKTFLPTLHKEMSEFYKKFPQLKGYLNTINSDSARFLNTGTMGYAQGNRLYLNPKYFNDIAKMNKANKEMYEQGLMSGTSTVKHELGHILNHHMYNIYRQKVGPLIAKGNYFKAVERDMKKYTQGLVNKAYKNAKIPRTLDNINKYASEYAKSNTAEMFTEVLNSLLEDNPVRDELIKLIQKELV